jgi:hypothetical protein
VTNTVQLPKPERLLGRNAELLELVSVFTDPSTASPFSAVLGGGGVGKTVLSLSSMNHKDVRAHFSRRLFAPCEGIRDLSELIMLLVDLLVIPLSSREHNLYTNILQTFGQYPTLLCLDNFEPVWEDVSRRAEIDDFL